jgi:hypothetical protein
MPKWEMPNWEMPNWEVTDNLRQFVTLATLRGEKTCMTFLLQWSKRSTGSILLRCSAAVAAATSCRSPTGLLASARYTFSA